ncbi:MAG TPA: methyltransferase [Candidatus Saccharimonadia bacterium]|nr:methyltransferase [Candidatus Saccharimonadia bacterium]
MATIDQLKQDIVFSARLRGHEFTLHSTWGIFSPKAIDEGTQLLIDQLSVDKPNVDCLDIGCGYGPLALVLAKLAPHGTVHAVDKDFMAVQYTAKNAQLNSLSNVRAYLSNGLAQVPASQQFDVIVSNVPAKIGSELLSIMLHDAHAQLRPGGKLYVVTISGLKDYMKRNLTEVFGNYDKLKQSRTYTAAVAVKR